MDRRPLDQLAREPLYNTRAVARTTGVPADTFRAWERRYGLPRPSRTATGQRLYSDRDIGVIAWLRERTDEGMTISQAIQRLRLENPAAAGTVALPVPADQGHRSSETRADRLRERLVEAAVTFDSAATRRTLDEATDLLGVETLADAVMLPALSEIDARWRRGEVPVTATRFASDAIRRRLSALLALCNPDAGRGRALVACAPGEAHDIGALVVAALLARDGWQVVPLGADIPVADLAATAAVVRPAVVCLSATTASTAARALDAAATLTAAPDAPAVVYGGQGFAGVIGARPVTGGASEVIAGVERAIGAAGEW